MRIVLFYHSLVSDWNHGNAHFLRGVCGELLRRGHEIEIFEPQNSWSLRNLIAEYGEAPVIEFHKSYPNLKSTAYDLSGFNLDQALDGADLVLVHEWNDHELVRGLSRHHDSDRSYNLLFHDTHHRSVTSPGSMAAYDLSGFDGVLAFGNAVRDLYLKNSWIGQAWTWHEAADTHVFRPLIGAAAQGDLVWIGNWGDDERTRELDEFLLGPVRELELRARVYGVRYPAEALSSLARSNIEYSGWLPNFRVPEVFAAFRLTVHIPRRPYPHALPGIPTIRVFEALACGIPLVCSEWEDAENLFHPGEDYLVARTGAEMKRLIQAVLSDRELARELAANGLDTIRRRHTCSHRVDELLRIHSTLTRTGHKENPSICGRD